MKDKKTIRDKLVKKYGHISFNKCNKNIYNRWLEKQLILSLYKLDELDDIKDFLECITNFDKTESLTIKGKYFDIVQKDAKKLMELL